MPAAGTGGRRREDRHRPGRRRPGHRGALGARRGRRARVQHAERWLIDLQQLPPEEVVTTACARCIRPTRHRPQPLAVRGRRRAAGVNAALKHIILFTDGFTDAGARRPRRRGRRPAGGGHHGVGDRHRRGRRGRAGGDRRGRRTAASTPAATSRRSRRSCRRRRCSPRATSSTRASSCPTITSSAEVVAGLEATPPLLGYVATTAKPQAAAHAAHRPRPGPAAGLVAGRPRAGDVVDERRRRPVAQPGGRLGRLRRLLDPRGEGHLPAAPPVRAG